MDQDGHNSSHSNSDTSETNGDNTAYRNKDIPRYRDPLLISSGENSPLMKEKDYFANDGMDDVLLLENISTPADQSKPKVLEEDDDVLEVSITLNRSKRKNDSQMDNFLTPSHKKRKSSSDKDSSFAQNNNTTASFISSPVTVDTSELNSSTQSANVRFQMPNFSTPIGKKISFGTSSTTTTKSADRQIEPSVKHSFGKSNSFSVSSTIPKSVNGISLETNYMMTPTGKSVRSAERTNNFLNNLFTVSSTVSKLDVEGPNHNDPTPAGQNILALANDEEIPVSAPPPPPAPKPVLVDISNLRPGMKDFDFYVKKQVVSIRLQISLDKIGLLPMGNKRFQNTRCYRECKF